MFAPPGWSWQKPNTTSGVASVTSSKLVQRSDNSPNSHTAFTKRTTRLLNRPYTCRVRTELVPLGLLHTPLWDRIDNWLLSDPSLIIKIAQQPTVLGWCNSEKCFVFHALNVEVRGFMSLWAQLELYEKSPEGYVAWIGTYSVMVWLTICQFGRCRNSC